MGKHDSPGKHTVKGGRLGLSQGMTLLWNGKTALGQGIVQWKGRPVVACSLSRVQRKLCCGGIRLVQRLTVGGMARPVVAEAWDTWSAVPVSPCRRHCEAGITWLGWCMRHRHPDQTAVILCYELQVPPIGEVPRDQKHQR